MQKAVCRQVVLSSRAYLSILAETYERVGTETGGILLGNVQDDVWYVIEVIDPGPNSIFTPTYFEYDTPYVNHLSNKVARFHKEKLQLLGLWHRHPGSFDSFSSTDDDTNRKYASQQDRGAISGLVNLDPELRLTFYHVAVPLRYTRVPVERGDHLIPRYLLELKSEEDFAPRQTVTTTPTRQLQTPVAASSATSDQKKEGFFGWVSKKRGSKKIGQLAEDRRFTAPEVFDEGSDRSDAIEDTTVPGVPEQEIVLDMLDNEMPYLESQRDYEYKIALEDGEVTVSLHYVRDMMYYPRQVHCILGATRDQERYAILNGARTTYRVGIIERYINDKVEEAMQRAT